MIGRNIETTIPDDGIELERARHVRVAHGASESGYRCVRVRADGRRVEVVMSMSPMRDTKGRVVAIASISRPASDKELADARFASLLDAAPDATICVDHDGRIAMVNAQVATVFGYPPVELIGSPFHALLLEDILASRPGTTTSGRVEPQSRGTDIGVPLFARRRNGSTFPVEVSLASSTTGGEEMVIVAVRDVSRQRATEAAVRENEARLRQLAQSVDILFILRQLEPAAYLYVSPGCRHVLGLDPEELMADPELIATMIHPEDRERVGTDYTNVALTGRPVTCEYRIVVPDGSLRWVRNSSTPVPEPAGISSRAVITLEDITERMEIANALKEAEASARAANNAKSEFLSRMSHELRTPLNAVLGFGQLLDRRLPNSEYSAYIGHILNGGRHLLALINDVLDIAGIESGAMSVSLEPVPLYGLIEETVQLMQPLADAAGITLITTPALVELATRADRQRLRQILLNLLSNAVKYNRPNGNVWIEASTTGTGHVTLSVSDDGPGIAAEYLPRVFTQFDRLGAETSTVEGTGIGLALTRSLTELMGGRISVSSDLSHGCTFAVTLPLAAPPAPVEHPPAPSVTSPDSSLARPATEADAEPATATAKMLYIEDNEPNVRVVEHLLGLRPGWTLIHAGLGTLGIELAEAHRPDLILLDLQLPDRSGADVLTTLKLNPATSAIPVAILSADANTSESQRLVDAGAVGHLTKPLDIDVVLALMDAITPATNEGARDRPAARDDFAGRGP